MTTIGAWAEWILQSVPEVARQDPPVDLDPVIERLGLRLEYVDDLPVWGELLVEARLLRLRSLRSTSSRSLLPWPDGQNLRPLAAHHFDARTRFTLAHEISHALLEFHPPPHPRLATVSGEGGRELERLCDEMAGAMLMPTQWLQSVLPQEPSLDRLRRAALKARVSFTAMAVRACRAGRPVNMIRWHRRTGGTWSPLTGAGVSRETLWQLRLADAGAQFERVPMKRTNLVEVDVHCGDHDHVLQMEIRRRFDSCLSVVRTVDGRHEPDWTWRCGRGGKARGK